MLNKFLIVFLIAGYSTTLMAKSILVLGDSISAAYGIPVDQGWVNLLQNKLQTNGNKSIIHNASISGDTTAGGLARIDRALQDYRPDIVILELGANDGLRGLAPKQIAANLSDMIHRCQAIDAKVLLLGMRIPPNYGARYEQMFYQLYPDLASKHQIPYIPFFMQNVALDKQYMQHDGLHPNQKAQPVMAEIVWKSLKEML